MNSKKKLEELLNKGKALYEKRIESIISVPKMKGGFNRGNEEVKIYNVSKEEYASWKGCADSVLDELNLKSFITPPAWSRHGNSFLLEEQITEIENVLKLCSVIKKYPPLNISEEKIALYIFRILESKNVNLLSFLDLAVGRENFKEVEQELEKCNRINIGISFSSSLCFNLRSDEYISLKGKKYFNVLNASLFSKFLTSVKRFFYETLMDIRKKTGSFIAGMVTAFILLKGIDFFSFFMSWLKTL